jgi:hypothetical protein
MSVKQEPSGRRWVEVEVEVQGTPEQVWEAIATGPGVSSWFVPTEIEAREDGAKVVTSHFGPGMDAVATATAWEPPSRFAAESAVYLYGDGASVAAERDERSWQAWMTERFPPPDPRAASGCA